MKNNVLLLCILLGLISSCTSTNKKETATAVATEAKKEIAPTKTQIPSTVTRPTMVDFFTCSRESDIREIYIEPVTPQGCKLWYSNYKTGSPTAWSTKGLEHCETVNQKIRDNLSMAGFKCQAANTSANTK